MPNVYPPLGFTLGSPTPPLANGYECPDTWSSSVTYVGNQYYRGFVSTSYYTHCQQYWDDFSAARLPVFQPSTRLELVPDNGSSEWKDLRARADQGGAHCASRVL